MALSEVIVTINSLVLYQSIRSDRGRSEQPLRRGNPESRRQWGQVQYNKVGHTHYTLLNHTPHVYMEKVLGKIRNACVQ